MKSSEIFDKIVPQQFINLNSWHYAGFILLYKSTYCKNCVDCNNNKT